MCDDKHNDTVRVACLYRVSTKRQLEENDIPMQKNACRAFIDSKDGWVLTREYTEKGVSGYHKSAEERDVLKQARLDAEQGLFDVLLVFMFDRLGRREDETPFVVEWFVGQGVAVWSVKEGRQTFDNRVDKLLNYIRFWQSGGESEKTSIRVKEKHRQMVLEGQYRGGSAPYGYCLTTTGKVNQKGIPMKKLTIDDAESETVRTIFRLAVEQGYGGRRIAGYLNERGIPTKKGNDWTPVSVTDLLKNPIYAGRYVSGRRPSKRGGAKRVPPEEWIYARDVQPALMIIDEALWQKAAAIRAARAARYKRNDVAQAMAKIGIAGKDDAGKGITGRGAGGRGVAEKGFAGKGFAGKGFAGNEVAGKGFADERTPEKQIADTSVARVPAQTRGTLLMTGLATCAVCGNRLRTRHAVKPAYRCFGNAACNGQKTFAKSKIDGIVLTLAAAFLRGLPSVDITDAWVRRRNAAVAARAAESARLTARIERAQKDLVVLKAAIANSLQHDKSGSVFSPAQLAEAISEKEKELCKWQRLRENTSLSAAAEQTEKVIISDWPTVFAQAPVSAQKMLLATLVREVRVGSGVFTLYAAFDWFGIGDAET